MYMEVFEKISVLNSFRLDVMKKLYKFDPGRKGSCIANSNMAQKYDEDADFVQQQIDE